MRLTNPDALRVFIAVSALSLACGELTAAETVAPAMILAQARGTDVDAARAGGATDDNTAAKTGDNKQLPEEQKHKVKSAVLMLSILSGIALSGLLLIIVAIAVRGIQRKLAGPTRLDCQPQDVLPEAVGHPEKETGAAGQTEDSDQASEETLFT